MGTYITQTDIENFYGTNNVTQWSNLDNSTASANTTRIDAGIAWAEAYVQDRLRGLRYEIPFSGASITTLEDIIAALAGHWLYKSRGDNDTAIDAKMAIHKAEADSLLAQIASGQLQLDLALNHSGPSAPVVV